MKRRNIFLFMLSAGVLPFAATVLLFSQSPLKTVGPTESLRRDIRLLNLINGLELRPDQMRLIADRAKESQSLLEDSRAFSAAKQGELDQILEEIKGYRLENRDVPEDLARRFHSLDGELKTEGAGVEKKLKAMASDVEKNLDPHQIYALDKFVPCIIPPKGESRIGQATDTKGVAERLARLRGIPDRVYERRRETIIERTVNQMKLRADPRAEVEDEKVTSARIGEFYDRVRRLGEVDFEIQKEKLAEEFVSLVKPKFPALSLSRKIQAFLLAPDIIPLLEAKIEKAQPKD
jgi:hypothetical protein